MTDIADSVRKTLPTIIRLPYFQKIRRQRVGGGEGYLDAWPMPPPRQ